MRKIISFMHLSLDGFVAGPNGEMDWIKVDEEIFDHVAKRIGEGDTALYGRITYEMMESYWPTAGDKPNASKHDIEHSKWYKKVHKIVLSKTMKDENLPAGQAGLANTTIISDNLSDRLNEIKQQSGKDILLFGSPTATHSLMQLNLIDGYWLFVNPIILGQGIPLLQISKTK
jgi:dihydrofolate reductase